MPTQVELQREIIAELAGQLLDGTYSLMGLPSLINNDRFMIVLDMSFFFSVEMGKPIPREDFDRFLGAMFTPFISDEWRTTFDFEEKGDGLLEIAGPNAPVGNARYYEMLKRFCDTWYALVHDLDVIVDKFRPSMARMPPRATDTVLRPGCSDAVARHLQQNLSMVESAFTAPWQTYSYLEQGAITKFVLYRLPFKLYRGNQDVETNAYVAVFTPHRLMRGIPDLARTFA